MNNKQIMMATLQVHSIFREPLLMTTLFWHGKSLLCQQITGWDALVVNGQVTGNNSSFTFADKPAMTLIHGFMKTPSVSGGAGITPVIKVGPSATLPATWEAIIPVTVTLK